MRLAECRVKLYSLAYQRLTLELRYLTNHCTDVCQRSIGRSKAWIFGNRLLEVRCAAFKAIRGSFVPKVEAVQICLIGLGTARVFLRERVASSFDQCRRQSACDA